MRVKLNFSVEFSIKFVEVQMCWSRTCCVVSDLEALFLVFDEERSPDVLSRCLRKNSKVSFLIFLPRKRVAYRIRADTLIFRNLWRKRATPRSISLALQFKLSHIDTTRVTLKAE